jgi:glycosyltransferase involved in cell wall biosynthesis
MRFLFVSDFERNPDSGAAGSLIDIADALSARGHAVDLAWGERPRLPGGLHRFLELPGVQRRQVESALAARPYDVVVVSQPFAFPVFERLPRLHPRTLFLNRTHGWEDRLAAVDQALAVEPAPGKRAHARRWVARRLTHHHSRRTARAAHGIVCASTPCARFIAAAYRVPPERIGVISYGVSPAFLADDDGGPRGARRLLYVGQYLERKGSKVLEAVLPALGRRFPDARLTFVVQPGAVEEVRARYAGPFGERLSVHGWRSRAELVRVYREHDLFVFPSLFEGFGKTFLEAMASGCCVVGFDEGGLSDLATDGVHALHCRAGDAARLAELLDSALADPARASAIGARARARARELTWGRTAAETERFCERMRAALPAPGGG